MKAIINNKEFIINSKEDFHNAVLSFGEEEKMIETGGRGKIQIYEYLKEDIDEELEKFGDINLDDYLIPKNISLKPMKIEKVIPIYLHKLGVLRFNFSKDIAREEDGFKPN